MSGHKMINDYFLVKPEEMVDIEKVRIYKGKLKYKENHGVSIIRSKTCHLSIFAQFHQKIWNELENDGFDFKKIFARLMNDKRTRTLHGYHSCIIRKIKTNEVYNIICYDNDYYMVYIAPKIKEVEIIKLTKEDIIDE